MSGDSSTWTDESQRLNLSMTIRGKESQRYICMNATGHLYSSLETREECRFREDIINAYSTFCSVSHPNSSHPRVRHTWTGRDWCIGVTRNGQILPGYRSKKNKPNSSFSKRPNVKNDSHSINWGDVPLQPITPSPLPSTARPKQNNEDCLNSCERHRPNSKRKRKCQKRCRHKYRKGKKSHKNVQSRMSSEKSCGNLFDVDCKHRKSESLRRNSPRRIYEEKKGLFGAMSNL